MHELVVDAPEGFRYVFAHKLPKAATHPEHGPLNPAPVGNVIKREITRHMAFHECLYHPAREPHDKRVLMLLSEMRRSYAGVITVSTPSTLERSSRVHVMPDMQFNWLHE